MGKRDLGPGCSVSKRRFLGGLVAGGAGFLLPKLAGPGW
ncbi:hypothetical protein HNP00_004142 [Arthrobacter sp. AZCC_0090]|nr:hypothetical protein [Arthrobacter sp. AZCC_0090]